MNETLVKRIEGLVDRWNHLPRQSRHELSGRVTGVSLGLGEIVKLHRELVKGAEELEEKIDRAEAAAEPDIDGD